MNILDYVITLFIILEFLNILTLYFKPNSKRGNGVGVFNVYSKLKSNEGISPFVSYLINWIAGTKLIFIMLLIVTLILGDNIMKIFSIIALIISISTFYWKLYPIIKELDNKNQISPKGYSKTLAWMIFSFIFIFLLSIILYYI